MAARGGWVFFAGVSEEVTGRKVVAKAKALQEAALGLVVTTAGTSKDAAEDEQLCAAVVASKRELLCTAPMSEKAV